MAREIEFFSWWGKVRERFLYLLAPVFACVAILAVHAWWVR